jgi:tryptophan-rich sensory protein
VTEKSGVLKPSLVAAGTIIVVAGLGGAATRLGPWYANLRKPSWQPPDWAFGPAWTLIFTLIGVGAVLAWRGAESPAQQQQILVLFGINAVLNILWSVLFFTLQRPDWALWEIVPFWLSIVALIVVLGARDWRVGALLLPYAAWVAFAAYLNLTIVRLNAPFT